MSKGENIQKAYEHYQNRNLGRPIQIWLCKEDGAIAPKKKYKGAIPKKMA